MRTAFCLTTLLGVLMAAGAGQARTLEVGPGKDFKQPSDAIAAAKAGDTVSIQPGEYFDCATLKAPKMVVEGVGDAEKVVITDKACNGKGLFIVTGDEITIRNLTLTRARVPDGNGAGIRNEAPTLTVDHVRFVNNQNGILSTPPTPGTVTVRNSLFDQNGSCVNGGGGCAHGLYSNAATLLRIENTVFSGTKQGHHIKSRGARTEIVGCSITDGPEGTASYLIDIPNGGSLVVQDSKLEKGPEAENHSAAITIGEEGVTQPTREIVVQNTSFRNDGGYSTTFVNNMTATEAMLVNDTLSGASITPLKGDGKVTGHR